MSELNPAEIRNLRRRYLAKILRLLSDRQGTNLLRIADVEEVSGFGRCEIRSLLDGDCDLNTVKVTKGNSRE